MIHHQKNGKDKWIEHMLVSAATKFRHKKKFRYGIPAYTVQFPALFTFRTPLVNQPVGRQAVKCKAHI
jgi:hypothetical protein